MNQLKIGAILSYVGLGLSNIIALAYTPFMLRMLGQSEYGLYSLVASVVAYLNVLDFGFGSAIVRYTAKFRAEDKIKEQYSMFGMFFLLYSAIGLFALVLGLGLYFNVDSLFSESMTATELSKARLMILLLVLNLAITFPLSVFSSIITAYENFVFQRIVNLIRIVLNPLVMVCLLLFGYKAIAMVVVTSVFNILSLAVDFIYCKRKLKINIHFDNFDWGLLKEIGAFSFFIFMKLILDKFYWSTGQFVIGVYSGAVAVAIYAIAMQMRNYYLAFSGGITNVFLPKVTMMVANNSDPRTVSDLFIKVGRIQCFIVSLVICGFILFGKPFIIFWAGNDYAESYLISLVIMIPFSIPLLQTMGHVIIQAMNKQKFQFYVYILIAIITLCLSIPLTKYYSGLGAAIAVSAGIIVGEIFAMNWFYYKKLEIDILSFWREMSLIFQPSFFILIIFGVYLYYFPIKTITDLIVDILFFIMVYIPTLYITAMNKFEKGLLKSAYLKIVMKIRSGKRV